MNRLCNNCTHYVFAFGMVHYIKRGIVRRCLLICIFSDADLVTWWESYQAMGVRYEVKGIQGRARAFSVAF